MNNCYLEELPYSNLNEYLANIGKYTKASRYRIEEKRPVELSESIKELAEKYADSDKYKVEAPTEGISYCYSQIITHLGEKTNCLSCRMIAYIVVYVNS